MPSHPPGAASPQLFMALMCFFLLYYCCCCVVLLSLSLSCSLSASVCLYRSRYLPVSLTITSPLSIPLRLLRDRLLLALVVVSFCFFLLYLFAEALISASHCCLYSFSHFSSSSTIITSLLFHPPAVSISFFPLIPTHSHTPVSLQSCPPLPTYTLSLAHDLPPLPLLLLSPRLSLRPQDVRRCPVGPEVKPRLSTSHPTRHFDSSISSLCVVCVVLSVGRRA